MAEDPTIETPAQPDPEDDAKALMEELKKLDIQTPTDIHNVVTASQEAGKAWNEVGALRKEVERLTNIQNQSPAQQEYYGEDQSVDLGKVVEDKVQGVLNRYLEGQQQAQQQAVRIMSEVRNDPEYGVVGQVFEKYINSPEAMMRLQTGQTDVKTEFLNTKAAYFRNLAQRSSKTLEGLMDKTKPPHMETGDTQTAPATPAEDERKENLKKIKKAQQEGSLNSEQALEKIIKSSMPDIENDISFYTP